MVNTADRIIRKCLGKNRKKEKRDYSEEDYDAWEESMKTESDFYDKNNKKRYMGD